MTVLSTDQIKYLGRYISEYQPLTGTHAAFHASTANIRWLFGGNQSSKTYTNMMDLAMQALETHPYLPPRPRAVHWACIKSWELVRETLWNDKLRLFIPDYHIEPDGIVYGQERVPKRVYLKNGHVIEFKAFSQGSTAFEGRSIDTIHCDEQAEYDFDGIFRELQARLLRKSGLLSWSMTPVIPQPDLEERIARLPETDEAFWVDLEDNRVSRGGYIEDKRVDQMIDDWPEETQLTRKKGRFSSYFGAVFKTFDRNVHSIQPFAVPTDWVRFGGIDFGFCYSSDTEVLTQRGWLKHKDIQRSDKVACYDVEKDLIIWDTPIGKWEQEYKGKMIEVDHTSSNFLVSPEHTLWIEREHKYSQIKAKDLLNIKSERYKIKIGACEIEKDEGKRWFDVPYYYSNRKDRKNRNTQVAMSDWLRFLGWYITEGCTSNHLWSVYLTQLKNRHAREIEDLLKKLPYTFHRKERINKQNKVMVTWLITCKELVQWLDKNCGKGSRNKRIPNFIFDCSIKDRREFLSVLISGDGTWRKDGRSPIFSSTSLQLLDQVQRLAITLGNGSTKSLYTNWGLVKGESGKVSILKKSEVAISKKHIREIDYNGKIYCLKTRTGYYVTRRKGKPAIQGNTNPFVLILAARDPDGNWYIYWEYYVAKATIDHHTRQIKPVILREHLKGIFADPENSEDRAYLRAQGIPTLSGRSDVSQSIETVQAKLKIKTNGKPSLFIFCNCKNTLRELASYQYPTGTDTRDPKDIPLAKNDHTIAALRYILHSVEHPRRTGTVEIA